MDESAYAEAMRAVADRDAYRIHEEWGGTGTPPVLLKRQRDEAAARVQSVADAMKLRRPIALTTLEKRTGLTQNQLRGCLAVLRNQGEVRYVPSKRNGNHRVGSWERIA